MEKLFDFIDLIKKNSNKKRFEIAKILNKETGVNIDVCELFIKMYN